MHNSQIPSWTVPILVFSNYFSILAIWGSQLTLYNFYVFISGMSSFSHGGIVSNKTRCFDVFECSQMLCDAQTHLFESHLNSCSQNYEDYLSRLPSWMSEEYENFMETLKIRLYIFVVFEAFLFLLPLFSKAFSFCANDPIQTKRFSICLCFFGICAYFSTTILIPETQKELQLYSPTFPDWIIDSLNFNLNLSTAVLWVQFCVTTFVVLVSQALQKNPEIQEFRPLIPHTNEVIQSENFESDDLSWGKIETIP